MADHYSENGICCSDWSVDIFDNDAEIAKLLCAHGWKGFGVYFFLCQRAYGSKGYFYEWGYDKCESTANEMSGGISPGTVKEAVCYCLQIGLFNKRLFERWGILTSRGIQKRFCLALNQSDNCEIIAEYWLLHEWEECKGLLKLPLNTYLSKKDTDSSVNKKKSNQKKNNIDKNIKRKKEKYPKEKSSVVKVEQEIETVIAYMNNKLGTRFKADAKKTVSLLAKLFSKGYTSEDMQKVIDNKYGEWNKTEYAKYLRPSTLFGEKFDEYLNQIPVKKSPDTKFHNFEQRSYESGEFNKFFIN